MSKTFKEIREEFKQDSANLKKEYREQRERDKADIAERYKTKRMGSSVSSFMEMAATVPLVLISLIIVVGFIWFIGTMIKYFIFG